MLGPQVVFRYLSHQKSRHSLIMGARVSRPGCPWGRRLLVCWGKAISWSLFNQTNIKKKSKIKSYKESLPILWTKKSVFFSVVRIINFSRAERLLQNQLSNKLTQLEKKMVQEEEKSIFLSIFLTLLKIRKINWNFWETMGEKIMENLTKK